MPFALTTVGLFMVVLGFQDTYKQAGTLIAGDFTGKNNFIYFFVAIMVLGGIGYIKGLETFSRALMALIIVVLFLANKGGVFTEASSALSSGTSTADTAIGTPLQGSPSAASANGGASSSSSNPVSGIIGSVVGSLF